MNKKLVYGVGVYERGEHAGSFNGKQTSVYALWAGMMERCYSERKQKKSPTYIGCSVSEEFSNFQKFAEWCNNQVGFGIKGYHLDKDIIYKGNKQYNRESCAFVPREVNMLPLSRNAFRGEHPVGVYFHKRDGKFRAKCGLGAGAQRQLGHFSTPEEAFSAYKEVKEAYIKEVAEKYKDSIDPRVYQALMEWEVHFND